MCKQKLFVIVAAVIGIIALFLPFVSFMGMSANALKYGSDGYILLGLFVVPAALCFLGKLQENLKKPIMIVILIFAILALGVLVLNLVNALELISMLGIGFWLAMVASIAIPAVVFVFKNK